jgi:hypothetical protein
MEQSESFSKSGAPAECRLAERELSAFIAAVTELSGPEQAGLTAQDRIDESELVASHAGSASQDWRTVTIAASVRLASRLSDSLNHQMSLGTPTADMKASPIPSSNCFDSPLLV